MPDVSPELSPGQRELYRTVLSDPGVLWALLTAEIRVAGPWCYTYGPDGTSILHAWRLTTKNIAVATVMPSHRSSPPDIDDCRDTYGEDGDLEETKDEMYDSAMAAHIRDVAAWRPWRFTTTHLNPSIARNGYADTLAEVLALADDSLRFYKYTLVGGSTPPITLREPR